MFTMDRVLDELNLENSTQTELLELIRTQNVSLSVKETEIEVLRTQIKDLQERLRDMECIVSNRSNLNPVVCSWVTSVVTRTSVTLTNTIPTITRPSEIFSTGLMGGRMSTGVGLAKGSSVSWGRNGRDDSIVNELPKSTLTGTRPKENVQGISQESVINRGADSQEGNLPEEPVLLVDITSDEETTGLESEDEIRNDHQRSGMKEMADLIAGRGAPKPEPFTLDPGRSFIRFLEAFEAYCSTRYSSKQKSLWTPELGRLLKDEAYQVYRACGGPDQKYSYMKRRLEEWYDSAKTRVSSSRKLQYENARPMEGEGLKIFATRLEHLYRKAYPGKGLDGKDLKRRLVGALPRGVVDVLERDLALVRAVNGRQNTWSNVLMLLEAQDESVRRGREVVENKISRNPSNESPWLGSVREKPKVAVARTSPRPNYRKTDVKDRNLRSPATFICNWCKRPGHIYDYCRRRLNQCLRCGSPDHFVKNCPQPQKISPKATEFLEKKQMRKMSSSSSSGESGEGKRGRSRTRRHSSRTFRRHSQKRISPLNSDPLV